MLTVARSDRATLGARADRGATRVQLRPLEPTDLEHLVSLFDQLSARSRYLRFFTPMPEVPAATLRHLASVDHRHHEAVGAFAAGSLVGAAHYFRSRSCPTRAELSGEVADPHQGRGLGACLLRELARRAQQHGITHLTATVLAENAAALSLLRSTGWPLVSHLDGPGLEVVVALPERP